MSLAPARRKPDAKARSNKNPAFGYYRSVPAKQSRSPFRKKQPPPARRRWLVIGIDILVLLVIAFSLIHSLIVQPLPRIHLSDSSYHPPTVYRSVATEVLQAFKNRNKITLDERQITAALQQRFPEIINVDIHLPILGQTPLVNLTIAAPSFFLDSGGRQYLVNAQGKIVAEKKDFPQVSNLPTVLDQSGFIPDRGGQILGPDAVSFIKALIAQCQKSQIPIASVSLPPVAQQLDLRTADRPYFVKFYLDGEPLQQIGQFVAARQQFDLQNAQPTQYLDVRIAGKIFYQ